MFDIRIIYDTINNFKKLGISLNTNCFFNNYKLMALSEQEDAKLYVGKASICLLYNDFNFTRLYYWITDLNAIPEVSDCVINDCNKTRDIIIELIGFDNAIDELERRFSKAGIKRYAKLSRYRTNVLNLSRDKNDDFTYSLVDNKDIEKIQAILKENLDPYISHLPTEEYLNCLNNKKSVYGAYLNRDLIGVCCLEDIGLHGKYLYEIAVRKNYHGRKIGQSIADYAFSQCTECNNYATWIEENNVVSKKIFKNLGFKVDKLKTRVLIYGKIKY